MGIGSIHTNNLFLRRILRPLVWQIHIISFWGSLLPLIAFNLRIICFFIRLDFLTNNPCQGFPCYDLLFCRSQIGRLVEKNNCIASRIKFHFRKHSHLTSIHSSFPHINSQQQFAIFIYSNISLYFSCC